MYIPALVTATAGANTGQMRTNESIPKLLIWVNAVGPRVGWAPHRKKAFCGMKDCLAPEIGKESQTGQLNKRDGMQR